MPHNDSINTLISQLLIGEITQEESDALLQKVKADPSLKEKIEKLMNEDDFVKRYQLYRSINAEEAKERFKASIAAREEAIESTGKQATFIWLRRIAALTATIALIVIGSWMLFHKESPTPVVSAELTHAIERIEKSGINGASLTINGKTINVKDAKSALAQTKQLEDKSPLFHDDEIVEGSLVTKRDKEFWMVLDDGTYVHLNYNTTLTYPNHFVGSERKVKLKGEAYFVIANDPKKRPFIVETAHGDVHDYGTEFNVNTTAVDGTTNVVLVKGKVGVSSKHGKEYLLKPGEMATLQMGRTPNINKVNVNLYTSWNTGNFYFDGCTLADLMKVISNWYDKDIHFASDDIKDMRFTGNIDKYEPMYPTLHAIESITGLKIHTDEKTITISRED